MTRREERGLIIAATSRLSRNRDGTWRVPSQLRKRERVLHGQPGIQGLHLPRLHGRRVHRQAFLRGIHRLQAGRAAGRKHGRNEDDDVHGKEGL